MVETVISGQAGKQDVELFFSGTLKITSRTLTQTTVSYWTKVQLTRTDPDHRVDLCFLFVIFMASPVLAAGDPEPSFDC